MQDRESEPRFSNPTPRGGGFAGGYGGSGFGGGAGGGYGGMQSGGAGGRQLYVSNVSAIPPTQSSIKQEMLTSSTAAVHCWLAGFERSLPPG